MKNKTLQYLLVALGAVLVGAFVLFVVMPYFFGPVEMPQMSGGGFGSQTVRARVDQIIEEGEIDLGGTDQRHQIACEEIREGRLRKS